MKIKQLVFSVFILFNITIFGQNSNPELSFGIVQSGIKTIYWDWQQGNNWRKGFWVTLNQNNKVAKWFGISTGLTYQERIPLEVFSLNYSLNNVPSVASRYTFGQWPSNPQNRLFDEGIYVRFPNFKYLNLEVIPNVKIGSTFSVTAGVGLFGGILLNKKNATITIDKLPSLEGFVGTPYIYGEFEYHKYDWGWIPQLNIDYQINDKIKIGALLKSYRSLTRLNDSFVDPSLYFNMRWEAYAYGLNVQYNF